jgi:putative PEP-CTERM system TPR-repeat lipoprotein
MYCSGELEMSYRAVVLALLVATAGSACSKSASYFYESGNQYFAAKQYPEAILQYRSAVTKNPQFAPAHVKLAEAYEASGDTLNSTREYVRAADLLPKDGAVQLKAAKGLLMLGQFEDARTRAQRILENDPKYVEAQILRGNALAGLKDFDAAIADVQDALKSTPDSAATHSNLGAIQMAKGNLAEAEKAFSNAVAADPKSLYARLALANFYWSTNRNEPAEATLKEALALAPGDPLPNFALAIFYVRAGRPSEAEAPLKIVATKGNNSTAKLMLIDYYLAVNRLSEATTMLEALSQEKANYTAAKLRLAALARRQSKPDEAYRIVREVLKNEPGNVAALLTNARMLLADGKTNDALNDAKAAVSHDPRSADAHFVLGLVTLDKNPDEAVTEFNEALKLDPSLSAAKYELTRAYLAKGDAQSAVKVGRQAAAEWPVADTRAMFVRALLQTGGLAEAQEQLALLVKAFPKSSQVQVLVARLAMLRHDNDAARRAFEMALNSDSKNREALAGLVELDLGSKNPAAAEARLRVALGGADKDARLMMLLAQTHIAAGNTSAAEQDLKRLISVDPSSLEPYTMLGRLYAEQRRLPEALAEFESVAERDRTQSGAAAQTAAAMILQLQGKSSEAQKRYQRAIEINPNAAFAANNLAYLYAQSGSNLDVALQLAQNAKAQVPNHPDINDTLGWIYALKGLPSLAIPPLTASTQANPSNATYAYHLGVAYSKAGDKAKAKAALERAVKLGGDSADAREAKNLLASM